MSKRKTRSELKAVSCRAGEPSAGWSQTFETLEANNPAFDEPTLGVLARDQFYFVANSQWGAIDEKGRLAPDEKLREPVVLKLKL
ncbi:MAG: hypothetical protein LC785_11810 [Acidobacteria bacterium]|nr:hypothetical protein [Acidobacteriota bacterium]